MNNFFNNKNYGNRCRLTLVVKTGRSIVVLLAFTGLFVLSCNNKSGNKRAIEKNILNEINIKLKTLLKPTNSFAISTVPVTTLQTNKEQAEMSALGFINYDTRAIGTVSARVAGRIEKLYVRFRFESVKAGQRIMDIYSPELLTAQQNLIFLLKNDPANIEFIKAAKDKLMLLGMSNEQVQQVTDSRNALFAVSVYSRYSGHIHDASGMMNPSMENQGTMKNTTITTEELQLKEGMYVSKGQTVFSVYNPDKTWALLNFYADNQALIKIGNNVTVTPETEPQKTFNGKINFIEPVFRNESRTVTARVYFDNSKLQIPVNSQVRAKISAGYLEGNWLPKEAVISLGLGKVVFVKQAGGFMVQKVETGFRIGDKVQILSGLNATDTVAANAQYLVDSESFIKSND